MTTTIRVTGRNFVSGSTVRLMGYLETGPDGAPEIPLPVIGSPSEIPLPVIGSPSQIPLPVIGKPIELRTRFIDAATLEATVPAGLAIAPYFLWVTSANGNTSGRRFAIPSLGSSLYIPVAVKNVGGDDSGIQVQNVSTSSASVYAVFYTVEGTVIGTIGPQTVAPGGSWTAYLPDIFRGTALLPDIFDGSIVFHSTQSIAGILNRVNYAGSLASTGSLTVPPLGTGTQVTIPLVYGGANGYFTTISVQNPSPIQATYTFSLLPNGSGGRIEEVVSLPPLGGRRIRVGVDVAAPANFVGTATIGSNAPFTAVAETRNDASRIWFGAAGVTTGTQTIYAPLLFKNYNGWGSGAQIANMSNSPITVNLTLRDRDTGLPIPIPPETLAPRRGFFYDLRALPAVPDGFVGSGVFTTNGAAGLTVQGVNAGRATGTAYGGFSTGTTRISVPLVFNDANGWDTGVQVQNLGAGAATVNIAYHVPGGQPVSDVAMVSAGDSVTFYQPANTGLPKGLTGSATITSNGQPIVAIVNEVNYIRGGDAAMAYEGINH